MNSLKVQRCFNHANREAVARCARCGNFFCRECVTEHAGRMTCGRCLGQPVDTVRSFRFRSILTGVIQLGIGLLILWFCFFMAGRGLLLIPSSFHEGHIWRLFGERP